jgi:hypothetical protein
MVDARVTCPFVGSAVLGGLLPAAGAPDAPVARVAELAALGDTGGGDLGAILAFFARANHGWLPGADRSAASLLPDGLFSLDFPGSQGSHPGHSGILEADPAVVASGRFDADAYARLTGRAQAGVIPRAEFGAYIAANLVRDPKSTVLGWRAIGGLGLRLAGVVGEVAWLALRRIERAPDARLRTLDAAIGRLLAADNLLGSAGEFALLFALLQPSPRTRTVRGAPALSTADLDALFVERRLPEGWDAWRKTAGAWAWNLVCLAAAALVAYRRLARAKGGAR